MAKILLVATGGTIAMRKDVSGKVVPAVSGHDLLESMPDLYKGADWDVVDFSNLASCNISPARMFDLARVVEEKLENSELAGVIITHGTDTLEESAFFFDLTLKDIRPIIFTASQRDASESDSDGPRNLANAMRIVLNSQAQNRGAMIALSEEIHAARDVRKLHTSHVNAFDSGEVGALGAIDGEEVLWRRRVEPTRKLGLPPRLAEVGICKAFTGMPAGLIMQIAGETMEGLVIEAFGRGNLPPEAVGDISRLVDKGVPVVITSRCLFGRTAPVYGYPGGGADLEKAGAWFGGNLSTEKARLLLSIALGHGLSHGKLKQILADSGVDKTV